MAENTFDRFSVFFTGDTVFLGGTVFPLGQLTTDVLNLDGKVLTEIDRCVNHFISVVWTLLQEKTDSAARSAQERLNAVWDLVFDLPVYRSLRLDTETAWNLFPDLLPDRAKWSEVLDVDSEGHRMFGDFLSGLEYFAESLRNFRGQLNGMLDFISSRLPGAMPRRMQKPMQKPMPLTLPTWQLRGNCFSRNRNLSRAFPRSFALSRRRILQKEEKSF